MLGAEQQIKETYVSTGQVKLVFAPVLNHQDRSLQTHQGAECAAEQGQFWEFHDALFENQGRLWSGDVRVAVKQLAAEHGLDAAAFNACLDEQRHLELVQAQDQIRLNAGIRGQPVFDINGQFLAGAQPFSVFQQAIETALTE